MSIGRGMIFLNQFFIQISWQHLKSNF